MKKISAFLKTNKIPWAITVLVAVCILFMLAEIINHRFWMSDFEVYYKSADRILHGENLYRIVADGHYIFKYSPTSAALFIPFLVFPFGIAKIVYWLLLTFLVATGFILCIKIIEPSLIEKPEHNYVNIIMLMALLTLAIHFMRELHLGQVNYLLLFMYIWCVYLYKQKKSILFTLLLAITIFIKPFTLIFIPFLLLKKKYYEMARFSGFMLVLFLVPFLFYGSVSTTLGQYQMWINELLVELSHKQGLLDNANHTVFSVFARYTPVRFLVGNIIFDKIYQLMMLGIIALLFIWFTRIKAGNCSAKQKEYNFFIEFSLLVACIPLLAFTSENAFIYTQMLVFIILLNFKNLRMSEKILAILGFVFIGGNFGEMLGRSLSKTINDISLISIGTIILIYLLFALRIQGKLAVESVQKPFLQNKD